MIHPSFKFCEESMSTFLTMTNGFIAGSAALHALISEKFEEDWVPNDLDIWIPVPGVTKEQIQKSFKSEYDGGMGDPTRRPAVYTLTDLAVHFMADHGWKRAQHSSGFAQSAKEYMEFRKRNPYIMRIFYFASDKSDRKIQIIFTADVPPATILDTFDISGCKVAWNPTQKFKLTPPAILEQLTKDPSTMYITDPEVDLEDTRTRQRIAKYQRRGFTIYVRAPDLSDLRD